MPLWVKKMSTCPSGAFHGLLAGGRIADRTARDPQTVAWRELARLVREEESLTSAVLPAGSGLLVATKTG